MYPQADIPALQLSLLRRLDPSAHLALGKALRGLIQENILVVGSAFSFHNLRAFFGQALGTSDSANDAFQHWLVEVCPNAVYLLDVSSIPKPPLESGFVDNQANEVCRNEDRACC